MRDYTDFLASKLSTTPPCGFDVAALPKVLFPFQRDLTRWALRMGRAALFCDTGLGKTAMQVAWSVEVTQETGRPVLILAPLAVAAQTVREAARLLGVQVTLCREPDDVRPGVNVTNYDRLHRFDPTAFGGVVLDESSILKAFDGKTRTQLIRAFASTPYRLACTATPAPNDFTELGNHAEFLGVCTRSEMLSEYFVHDSSDTQTWRLKGHARKAFWNWVASWAALVRKPSDLGYPDAGYDLPPLVVHKHIAPTSQQEAFARGLLFTDEARTLTERREARKASIGRRVELCAETVRESWTKNKSANTTEHIASPTSRNFEREVDHGTPIISSANASDQGRISDQSPKRRSAKRTGNTLLSPLRSGAPTCASDTSESASSSSPSIGNGEQNVLRLSETGTSAPNTESLLLSTTQCLLHKEEHALSAARSADSGSLSTMTTQRDKCEDYSAKSATAESDTLRTRPKDSDEQWIIWCELNAEADLLARAIPGSVNVQGSDSSETKEQSVMDFIEGRIRVLISKPSILGWGLNFQFCSHMCFIGVTDSFESFYQAVRRTWRFGQTQPVHVHLFASEAEGAVLANLERKAANAADMADTLSAETVEAVRAQVRSTPRTRTEYAPGRTGALPSWLGGSK